jgi:hypothetical protein
LSQKDAMRTLRSVSLPERLAAEFSRLAARTGRSKTDIVKDSLGLYLWEPRSRAVRKRLMRRAKRTGVTAEDDVSRAVL